LDCPLPASEARLISPQGTEIAIRLWIGTQEVSAEEAAQEYEQTLGAEARGAHPSEQALVSAGGLRGLWFTVEGDPGERPLLAYVVYTAGTKRVALAVRGIKGHETAARQRLEATAASLRLGVVSAPLTTAPSVETPPSGETTPPTTTPSPPPPPPAGVPVSPPVPLPATNRVVMAGFLLTVPEGWRTSLERGTLWVEKPGEPIGYFLWPARAGEEETGPADLPARWAAEAGLELDLRSPAVQQGNIFFGLGNLTRGVPVAAAIYAWAEREVALVMGVYAPPAAWDQTAQTAKWLGETRTLGWRPAEPPPVETPQIWVDPSGEISLRLPAQWKAQGEVRQYNRRPVIAITARGGDMEFAWYHPFTPAFRDFTPILQAMGETEGSRYREADGEDYLRILGWRSPPQFVEYLLAQPFERLREACVERSVASKEVAALLPGEEGLHEGAVVWVKGTREGRPREVVYLVATASLPLRDGAFRWQAAFCSLEYPPGKQVEALPVLRALATGAQVEHPRSAIGLQLAPLVRALPGAVSEVAVALGATRSPTSLLGAGYEPAAAERPPRWSVAEGLDQWRALLALPEVQKRLASGGLD